VSLLELVDKETPIAGKTEAAKDNLPLYKVERIVNIAVRDS
jgi:hypothetical protein